MSTNLEIESKVMITKEDYKLLLDEFLNLGKYTQINYYIAPKDPKNYKKEFGLRIRKKKHKYELTLKEGLGDSKKEINQKIHKINYILFAYNDIFPGGEIKKYLLDNKIYNPKELRVIGKMKTERIDVEFEHALISIDKSKYHRTTDFEVECEDTAISAAELKLHKFLSSRGINYKKSEHSKLARFLNTK